MRAGIIQSSFIPWRGYFDFIASVDIFIFHDDIQYTKNDWRNRNRIKTPNGTMWLTVPVSYRKSSQLICDTEIDDSTKWRKKHMNQWAENYRKAAHIDDVFELLGDMGDGEARTISQLNIRLIQSICSYLAIHTQTILSSELKVDGKKTDRLINLLRAVSATTYLSGPTADNYLDKDAFRNAGITLEYKSYDYDPYPQLWGEFNGAVSVLDLIANCGLGARELINSKKQNKLIVL